MSSAENIWNVIGWYYGNNAVIAILLILMIIYLLSRKKENKWYVAGSAVVFFLLLNQITYRVIVRLGEGNTYYRFLWMLPIPMFMAWILYWIWRQLEKRQSKTVYVMIAAAVMFLYSGSSLREWTTLPENIYQISEDKVQVADLIEQITGGERAIVYADDDLLYGIREYNANICRATEGERGYLDHIITENDANAGGQLMLGILVNAHIDYIVVNKEYTGAQAALKGAGCRYAGETDLYRVYYADQTQLTTDLHHIYDQDWNTDTNVSGVESVMVHGLDREQQYLLYGDGKLKLFSNETGEEKEVFSGNNAFEYFEDNHYIICMIDNAGAAVSEKTISEFEQQLEKGKTVILVLKKPLDPENQSDRFTRLVCGEGTSIQQIIALNAEEGKRGMLNAALSQLSVTDMSSESALLLQVRGE